MVGSSQSSILFYLRRSPLYCSVNFFAKFHTPYGLVVMTGFNNIMS